MRMKNKIIVILVGSYGKEIPGVTGEMGIQNICDYIPDAENIRFYSDVSFECL